MLFHVCSPQKYLSLRRCAPKVLTSANSKDKSWSRIFSPKWTSFLRLSDPEESRYQASAYKDFWCTLPYGWLK